MVCSMTSTAYVKAEHFLPPSIGHRQGRLRAVWVAAQAWCYGFKAGSGTARGGWRWLANAILWALVQANHGDREELTIAGVPVGRELADIPGSSMPSPSARCWFDHCRRCHRCATLAPSIEAAGKACANGVEPHWHGWRSLFGDIFLAFSTANPSAARRQGLQEIKMLANDELDPLCRGRLRSGRGSDQRTGRRTHDDRHQRAHDAPFRMSDC